MTKPVRVLVVDDSAFARKVLREVLSGAPDLEVVGIARDGLEALEKIAELKPDVITLDLVMPNLDGLGVLRNMPAEDPPRAVMVSISDASSELAIRALELGAVDLVKKPTALATDQLYELGADLIAKVRVAALAKRPAAEGPPVATAPLASVLTERKILVIGTSTGGPQALTRLLPGIPGNFPLPIAIALHIPAGYTEALAARLNDACSIGVVEASQGLPVASGVAMLARGGAHLVLQHTRSEVSANLEIVRPDLLHVPSVDMLFLSAVEQYGSGVIGVVLTGMGDDGLRGARAIREAGGVVLTESASSCVIYGMPRAVTEAGYSSEQLRLSEIAARIVALL
jgi:two-component system chemotaxis response regulator CheB